MGQFPSEKTIVAWLQSGWGIQVGSLEFLTIGADLNAEVFKVNHKYFLKVKRREEQRLYILNLQHHAGVPVILPLKTVSGSESLTIDGFTLFLFPFIEGNNGFERELSSRDIM